MRRLAPIAALGILLLLQGYRFGVGDQAVQLTLVREVLAPGGLAGDLVADHAGSHPSWLWPVLAQAVRLVGWEALPGLFLGGWLACALAWLTGIDALARTLWPRGPMWLASLVVVGLPWLPGHHTWFATELLARTVAAPLLMWAVVWALRGAWWPAAGLVCLGIGVHGTTGVQAWTLLGLLALQRREWAWPLALGLLPLVLLAGHADPGWMDGAWWAVVRWRLGHHVDPTTWPASWWAVALAQLGLAALALRRTPALWPFVAVGLGWAGLATLAALGLRWAPLVQSHGWYAWTWLALVGVLGLLPRLEHRWAWGLLALSVVQVPWRWLGVVPERSWQRTWPAVVEDPGVTEVPWVRVRDGVVTDVHVKDGGEVALSRDFALAWRARIEARCGPLPLDELDEPRGYVRARSSCARDVRGDP